MSSSSYAADMRQWMDVGERVRALPLERRAEVLRRLREGLDDPKSVQIVDQLLVKLGGAQ